MVRTRKPKKPLSRGRRIVRRIFRTIGMIFLVLLVLFLIFFGKTLFRTIYKSIDTGYKPVDVKMTTEQKLKDLDYMYDLVCLQNPRKELIEKAYGISYEVLYKKYRDIVIKSENEYEFFSYMTCFVADLPGLHNFMGLPDYKRHCADMGYTMNDIYGTQEMKNYTYSWQEYLRDDVKKFMAIKPVALRYVDGNYVVVSSDKTKLDVRFAGGRLVSLNGKDPKTMCFEVFSSYSPTYDCGHDCYFRSLLFFNDRSGIKYTAEILMPDGNTVTTDLYCDPRVEIAFLDGSSTYPDSPAASDKSSEKSGDSPAVSDPDYVPTSYKITKDEARKLVYLNYKECNRPEAERLVKELPNALDEVNAETVIIDLRSNPGGTSSVANKMLLPILFSHDVEFNSRNVGRLNDHTKQFDTAVSRLFNTADRKIEKKDGYYYYREDASVKGQATRNYKIYVLTSQSTFSTADLIAVLCKKYDNAVLVGTNTGGEGVGGYAVNCILPESHFAFVYVPTVNEDYPEDSFKGIQPDVYSPGTLEESLLTKEMEKQGKDYDSYESRQKWDGTLKKVLNMVDGK